MLTVTVLQVREVAAMTLSGAMHCGFLQMNSDMLVSLLVMALSAQGRPTLMLLWRIAYIS